MDSQTTTPAKPSGAQLASMRGLCEHTGIDFVYPGSAAIARKAIDSLKAINVAQEACRARFLNLLGEYGLPTPDEVQHAGGELRFIWTDSKTMVVVDLDDAPTGIEVAGDPQPAANAA